MTEPRNDIEDLSDVRLLVAAGRAHSAQLLRQVLDMLGARRVHAVSSVRAAIDLLRTHNFAAVFCDEEVGERTADMFVHAARRTTGLVNPMVPIFLVCSAARRRDVEAARDLGFTDVLTRPFSPATVLRKIRLATIHPRPFIAAENFFGPDRRAAARDWKGGERRVRQARKVKVAAPADGLDD